MLSTEQNLYGVAAVEYIFIAAVYSKLAIVLKYLTTKHDGKCSHDRKDDRTIYIYIQPIDGNAWKKAENHKKTECVNCTNDSELRRKPSDDEHRRT